MTDASYYWDPDTYRALMAEEIPDYDTLRTRTVTAATARTATSVLDLGIGSGLSAKPIIDALPGARLVGVDGSADMLRAARSTLGTESAELVHQRLEDPLPPGPFDLVTSMLAVHHLDGPGKADLFRRVAAVLVDGGRFVLADLVVPLDANDVVTPIDGVEDVPSSLADQLLWLRAAGFQVSVDWQYRDLAVLVATNCPTDY